MAKYNNYKKYYETHTEQERKRFLDYYYANRERILAERREKRKNMPKIKKLTLKEQLEIAKIALRKACSNTCFEDCEYCEYIDDVKDTMQCSCYCEDDADFMVNQAMNFFLKQAEEEYKNGSMGN